MWITGQSTHESGLKAARRESRHPIHRIDDAHVLYRVLGRREDGAPANSAGENIEQVIAPVRPSSNSIVACIRRSTPADASFASA